MSRIGLVIPYWSDITKQELIEIGKLADELGYDSLWVPEMWGRDAFSLLSILALNTKRVKLATGVVSVFNRTPATIAQTIATLDEITEGRIMLGLGMSGSRVIEDWHGIKFRKPLQRTKEYVEIIRMILSGERVNYQGEIFKLKDFRLQFTPQRRDIPIYVASLGPKNIKLTAQIADGWIPFLVPREYLQTLKNKLITALRNSENDLSHFLVLPYIPTCISRDVESSKRLVREYVAYYLGGMGSFYNNMIAQCGYEHEANLISKSWQTGDKKEAVRNVSDRMLDAVAIYGTPSEGKTRIELYSAFGADVPILIFPPKVPRHYVKEAILELAPSL